jgi:hypothetical protein
MIRNNRHRCSRVIFADFATRLVSIVRFPDYAEEERKVEGTVSLILPSMHLCLYPDATIRKLSRTARRAYVDGRRRGTKAMHRFTSRTARFDLPPGKELYGRPGTPEGSTAPICRNYTSSLRGQTNYYSGTSIVSSRCLPGQSSKIEKSLLSSYAKKKRGDLDAGYG